MIYTTLERLHDAGACTSRYRYLVRHLGGIKLHGKNTLIPFDKLLEINGLDDTLWALQATTEPCDTFARLFACDCAERVLGNFEERFPNDKRPRQTIEVARRYAVGQATDNELAAAWSAARSAAESAAESDLSIEWQRKHLLEMLQAEDTRELLAAKMQVKE